MNGPDPRHEFALVLNYYQPWTYAGSERFLQLMREELAQGRRQAYVYVADAGARDEIDRRVASPEYANLALYEFLGPDEVRPVSPWARALHEGPENPSLASVVRTLEPGYMRAHYPATAFLELLEDPEFAGIPFLYDLIDLWDDFPSAPWGDREVEDRYLRRADTVIAVSQSLVERAAPTPAHLIPNAIDTRFQGWLRAAERPERPRDAPKRVLYMGGMGGSWFDWDLAAFVVESLPDHHFTFLGSTAPPPEEHLDRLQRRVEERIAKISVLPNARFVPEVPHDTLVPWLTEADVGLIPFIPSDLVTAVSPLKVYEYLGAGMPVVQIGMPDIEDLPGVHTARTHEEFVGLVREQDRRELDETTTERIRDFCDRATWRDRLAHIDRVVADTLGTE